jgi:DNA repair protein RecO (recombination protein O)
MATYSLTAVNVGSFAIGESDKVITLFSAERGLVKAVAKGARKPGAKISGKADLLNVNRLLLASGRSLDIITEAESFETFPQLRNDLNKLSYGLYYAELTNQFGQGLLDECELYFEYLRDALRKQSQGEGEPAFLCLKFQLFLLDLLGYKPELDACVLCREALADKNISAFDHDLGGILCDRCYVQSKRGIRTAQVAESAVDYPEERTVKTHITPLVWQCLILASGFQEKVLRSSQADNAVNQATIAGRKLIQAYIEHKAGRKMKALEMIN